MLRHVSLWVTSREYIFTQNKYNISGEGPLYVNSKFFIPGSTQMFYDGSFIEATFSTTNQAWFYGQGSNMFFLNLCPLHQYLSLLVFISKKATQQGRFANEKRLLSKAYCPLIHHCTSGDGLGLLNLPLPTLPSLLPQFQPAREERKRSETQYLELTLLLWSQSCRQTQFCKNDHYLMVPLVLMRERFHKLRLV